jgi:glucose-1-phosphate cytidylyltransferase
MKVVLLAGGRGTRLAEESHLRPKPMVEIGGAPILLHIMCIYAHHGHGDFLVAAGYKSECIKDYFSGFHLQNSDWVFHLQDGRREVLHSRLPPWRVSVVNTGLNTMTGGRILRLRGLIGHETFMVTYGDGVADIDVRALVRFHKRHGRLATITAVHPPARFGCLELDGPRVLRFAEKPQAESGWINGGFFVFEPGVFDYLADDGTVLEGDPLAALADDGQLMSYRHEGFWQPMDTLREKRLLEDLWNGGAAPWKVWGEGHGFSFLSGETGPGHRAGRLQRPLARDVA